MLAPEWVKNHKKINNIKRKPAQWLQNINVLIKRTTCDSTSLTVHYVYSRKQAFEIFSLSESYK